MRKSNERWSDPAKLPSAAQLNLQVIGGWFQATRVNPSQLSIIRIYSIPLGAQVLKNRSAVNVERFLFLIRFEQRGKLDELGLDL